MSTGPVADNSLSLLPSSWIEWRIQHLADLAWTWGTRAENRFMVFPLVCGLMAGITIAATSIYDTWKADRLGSKTKATGTAVRSPSRGRFRTLSQGDFHAWRQWTGRLMRGTAGPCILTWWSQYSVQWTDGVELLSQEETGFSQEEPGP